MTLKILAAAMVTAMALWFAAVEFRSFQGGGHGTQKVWFYDESEKKLYPISVNTVPPDKGIGGPSGDGVRAMVITFSGDTHDPGKGKIAYLQTYSGELKGVLERVVAAHAAGRIFTGQIPSRSSAFFQDNTLVKRVGETDWQPATSAEGQLILTEWRAWRGPGGERPAVCVP